MKTILVADDEYAILDAIELILGNAGYRVVTAVNGKEAVLQMERSIPHLVILDVMMPLLSGLEVLAVIRSRPSWKSLPVIIMSGAYPIDRQPDYSWNHWLDKPFQFDELLRRVAELCGPPTPVAAAQPRGRKPKH